MTILSTKKGEQFIVDDDLADIISEVKWHIGGCKSKYICGRANGYAPKSYLHRVLVGAMPDETVDHISGDTRDNRLSNLRICTQAENVRNSRKLRQAASKYKGVSLRPWSITKGKKYPLRKKWQAGIFHKNKKYSLGAFHTESEAALAYNKKALELFGEFAKLNEL